VPPSEEAQLYDLQVLKNLGFNMLRKHIKVENDLYYYACDRLGILVWQVGLWVFVHRKRV